MSAGDGTSMWTWEDVGDDEEHDEKDDDEEELRSSRCMSLIDTGGLGGYPNFRNFFRTLE